MARSARVPWRFYLACALLVALTGLLAQWAVAQIGAPEQATRAAATPSAAPTASVAATPVSWAGGQTVCASGDEPSYGLVDPCLPAQSPLE